MRMINNLKAEPPIFYDSLRHMVQVTAEKYRDKVLFDYLEGGEKKQWTYSKFAHAVESFGTALSLCGLSGKRIAVIGETHPAYLTTYIATVSTNSVIVPMDKELALSEIAAFFRHAEVDAVVYSATFNESIGKSEEFDFLPCRIPIAPTAEYVRSETCISFDDMVALGSEAIAGGNRTYAETEIDMEACCTLLFTSGTTGTSKGVMLSNMNLVSALNASTHSMAYGDTCTFVSVLPIHHTYEMMCGQLGVVAIGGSMLINDSIKHVMKNFAEYKPNTLILVPLFLETMHKRIFDEIRRRGMEKKVKLGMKLVTAALNVGIDLRKKVFGDITAAFGGNLTSIVCGGAPINPQIIKDFYLFGITVLEGYGITECSPLVAVNSPGKVRFHSVGKTVYGCEAKIDLDEGQKTGEILVKGKNVMLGYYKDPAATAQVFTDDGYFRTGDVGYMDKDGYIFITGRKKNVIILSNGKNVFPEELEEYLSRVPFITESVVLGRKSGNAETMITAIVVPDLENPELAGKTPGAIYDTVKAAINDINKRLPSFKHITNIEIRNEAFEKNTSHKIKRYLVK